MGARRGQEGLSARGTPPEREVQGFRVDPKLLTFAMMIFLQVWDWDLTWRERRRGFYTKWEVDLLSIAVAFCREETGWLRRTPRIADNLREIDGLIGSQDIAAVRADWADACEWMSILKQTGSYPSAFLAGTVDPLAIWREQGVISPIRCLPKPSVGLASSSRISPSRLPGTIPPS